MGRKEDLVQLPKLVETSRKNEGANCVGHHGGTVLVDLADNHTQLMCQKSLTLDSAVLAMVVFPMANTPYYPAVGQAGRKLDNRPQRGA